MKVYLTNLNESWIVDRLREEWYQHNTSISVDSIKQAEIIWIIEPIRIRMIPFFKEFFVEFLRSNIEPTIAALKVIETPV